MKIKKIFIRNLNSLKGDHTIDFEDTAFMHSGLFLISGPTGAGKSTILDAVSLALFNEIPRLGKISKTTIEDLGGIMTHNTDEAIAEVDYKVGEESYRSRWSIRTTRSGTLADYHMELTNLTSGEIFPVKKSQVPSENERIIKLNSQQFQKSILLSQGEFAQFLKAKPDERAELLEKLTGTVIYRLLGIKAFDRNKESIKLYEDKKWEIEQIQLMTEEEVHQFSARKVHIINILSVLNKELVEKNAALEKVKQFNQLNAQINTNLKELETLEVKSQNFGPAFNKLEKHISLNPFRESLSVYTETISFIEKESTELAKEEKNLSEKRSVVADALHNYAELSGEKVDMKDFLTHKAAFVAQYNKDLTTLDLKKAEGNSSKVSFEEKLANIKNQHVKYALQAAGKSVSTDFLTLQIDSVTSELIASDYQEGVNLQDFQQRNLELNNKIAIIKQRANDLKILEIHLKELQNLIEEIKNIEKIKGELSSVIDSDSKEISNLEKDLSEITAQYLQLKNKEPLKEIISHLHPGDNCPVCGSIITDILHHDFAHLGMLDMKRTDLESKVSTLNKKILSNNFELKNAENQIREKTFKMEELKQKIPVEFQDAEKLISEVNISREKIYELELNQKTLNRVFELSETLHQLKDLKDNSLVLDKLRDEYQLLNNNFKRKYKDKSITDLTNIIQDTIAKATESILFSEGRIEKISSSLKEKVNLRDSLSERLTKGVQSLGFTDLENARSSILPDDEFRELVKTKSELEETTNKLKGKVQSLREQTLLLKEEISHYDEEQLQSETEQLRSKQDGYNRDIGSINEKLLTQEKNKEKKTLLTHELDKIERSSRKWRLLAQLIGDAEGKKFSNYAQSLTLRHLLVLANARLNSLTDRYKLVMPETVKSDLEVADTYQGNVKRSVKTLSGGETFMISLAMALSLSDLASKNNPIDCLFIDEGFGTLDPDTLETAMNTLDQLQYQTQKQIGIISHVSSLKDRISTQIILSRDMAGYSTIEVS